MLQNLSYAAVVIDALMVKTNGKKYCKIIRLFSAIKIQLPWSNSFPDRIKMIYGPLRWIISEMLTIVFYWLVEYLAQLMSIGI